MPARFQSSSRFFRQTSSPSFPEKGSDLSIRGLSAVIHSTELNCKVISALVQKHFGRLSNSFQSSGLTKFSLPFHSAIDKLISHRFRHAFLVLWPKRLGHEICFTGYCRERLEAYLGCASSWDDY